MDQSHEQMKFLGFFAIFRESFKTIFSFKRIFAQITLSLILPLTIIFLAHIEISHRLFYKFDRNPLDTFTGGYESYRYSHAPATDWVHYWLFKLAYFTILAVFSLLSTSAVVYTVASVYTGRDVGFRKVMKVVPRVWKRLFVTFLCMFLALFIYNAIAAFIFLIYGIAINFNIFGLIVFIAIVILYILGFLYLTIVWQLASVVSVLETSYGVKAMIKSKDLVKGKTILSLGIFFVLYGSLAGIVLLYRIFVDYAFGMAIVWKVMIGLSCLMLLLSLFLALMVIQTVVYLVCKSNHREAIDKLSLSTYLGAYLGEVQPSSRVGEDIQLGRPQPISQV